MEANESEIPLSSPLSLRVSAWSTGGSEGGGDNEGCVTEDMDVDCNFIDAGNETYESVILDHVPDSYDDEYLTCGWQLCLLDDENNPFGSYQTFACYPSHLWKLTARLVINRNLDLNPSVLGRLGYTQIRPDPNVHPYIRH